MPLAGLEYPIVFIETGERDASGRGLILPAALLGLVQDENLFVDGTRWDGRYVPALVRSLSVRHGQSAGDSRGTTVVFDVSWAGLSDIDGSPLFDADAKPTTLLADMLRFLERFGQELAATREFCAWLQGLGILESMTASMTLSDGTALSLNGFYAIDQASSTRCRMRRCWRCIATARSGLLNGLQLSLANMRFLTERKGRRNATPNP